MLKGKKLRAYNSLKKEIENLVQHVAAHSRDREYWLLLSGENEVQRKINYGEVKETIVTSVARCDSQIKMLQESIASRMKLILDLEPNYIMPVIGSRHKKVTNCQ